MKAAVGISFLLLTTLLGCRTNIQLPSDIEQPQGSLESDVYYGLLVYLKEMDAQVPLDGAASYVRAVYRREGQELPIVISLQTGQVNQGKTRRYFVTRIQRYGQGLRSAMTAEQRATFVAAMRKGYYFDIQTGETTVTWKSRYGIKLPQPAMPPLGHNQSKSFSKPPREDPDTLLPLGDAEALIDHCDEVVVAAFVKRLVTCPRNEKDQAKTTRALPRLFHRNFQDLGKHTIYSAFVRWSSIEQFDTLEGYLANPDSPIGHGALFARCIELDRARTYDFYRHRAPSEAMYYVSRSAIGGHAPSPWLPDFIDMLSGSHKPEQRKLAEMVKERYLQK